MGVTIRKKPISDDRYSLFLDIVNHKQRHKEYLKRYVYKKPKNQLERIHNEEVWQFANMLRNKREQELFTDEVQELVERKERKAVNSNFFDYLNSYILKYNKKDKRMMIALNHCVHDYVGKSFLPSKNINEQFCIDFKNYLTTRYNGETPQSYFARFKKILKQAYREKVISTYPEVMNDKVKEHTEKDVLTIIEIQKLANTYCGNESAKKAFLFACYTGLRFCDIEQLKWKDIKNEVIHIKQSKTGNIIVIALSNTALKLIGQNPNKEKLVFDLPTHTAVLKNLKNWVRLAGIDKHITFHCARHTYGTNLAIYGNDSLIIANSLGQTTMKFVPRYVRVAEAMKKQAANSLPEIDL